MLIELIYCSQVDAKVGAQDIKQILAASRRNNPSAGLTGTLVFTGSYFLQCLEGDRNQVNETYQRIATDPRHRKPVVLSMREITRRSFGTWTMGYVGHTAENRALFLNYSVHSELDPYLLSAESVGGLLRELANAAHNLGQS